jgi:hypothetical protein
MFDYTNNFPIISPQPDADQLRFKAYVETPEFLDTMQGQGKVIDVNKINQASSWGYASGLEDETTQAEYRNGVKVLMAADSEMRGYMEDVAGWFGLNWFKDESKAAVVRGIFMGKKDPLSPIQYRDSELTPEALATTEQNLQIWIEGEKGKPVDPNNLTPNQKNIENAWNKLAYARGKTKAKETLGYSPQGFLSSLVDELSAKFDWLTNSSEAEGADLTDINQIRSTRDPNFDPVTWFNGFAADPTVQEGLLQYGISADTVAGAPNEDAAKFIVATQLSKNDLQRRISQYTPSWTDDVNVFATAMINDPDLIPGLALEAGVSTIAGTIAAGPVGTVAGGAIGLTRGFAKLRSIYQSSRAVRAIAVTAETAAKLPLGMAPSYAKKLGLLGAVGGAASLGLVGGGLTEYFRQKSEIAYAAASMYSDPDAQTEYDYEAVAWTGVVSGMFGGALFGLAPALAGAGFGATLNRIKGINLAKYGEPVFRDNYNKQWSLKGTLIGDSLTSLKNLNKKEKPIVGPPVDEKMMADAELNGVKPADEQVVAETAERVDRVDTRNIDSAEKATITPTESASKRYDNESKADYVKRVGATGLVTDIVSFSRELARVIPDALDNLVLSSSDWSKMTAADKIKVLSDAEQWIEAAKKAESQSPTKLTLDRAKVYEVMEKQRKAYIRNLAKTMTELEYKQLKKQLKGEKVLALPEALAIVRNDAASKADRKAAADSLAADLVTKARELAKNPENAPAIRESVPAEVLIKVDELATEIAIRGNVSAEKVAEVRANVAGETLVKGGKIDFIDRSIKRAFVLAKIDDGRKAKIQAVIDNPQGFASIVTGNQANAQKFLNFTNKLRMIKFITETEQELLLASVVHLNFDARAFGIEYKLDTIRDSNNKVRDTFIGQYDPASNTITINKGFVASNKDTAGMLRTTTVLHELGHAFFYHHAKGETYLDALRLYNRSTLLPIGIDDAKLINDPMFEDSFLRPYHYANAEETFVETFSKILFSEAEFTVKNLKAVQVSMAQSILDKIGESLVFAADLFGTSAHYAAAKSIMERLTTINAKLNDGVSVSSMTAELADAVNKKLDLATINQNLVKKFNTSRYNLTPKEFDLLSKVSSDDPSFIVAFTVAKTENKLNGDYKYLMNAYLTYKQTQRASLLFRVSHALRLDSLLIKQKVSKAQRLAFFENSYFDATLTSIGEGIAALTAARAPTYQDRILIDLPNKLTGGTYEQYGASFWLSDGKAFEQAMDDLGVDTSILKDSSFIQKSLLDSVRDYLREFGYEDISNTLVTAASRKWALEFATNELFNVLPPAWDNADIAKTAISDLIQAKADLPVVLATFQQHIDPVLLKTILDMLNTAGVKPEEALDKLLQGIYNGIDNGTFNYNSITKKWQTEPVKVKKPRKPAAAAKPKVEKPAEQVKLEAAAANSEVVTIDNLNQHIQKLLEDFSRIKNVNTQAKLIDATTRIWLNENNRIKQAVEAGTITTSEQLLEAIKKAAKNLDGDEGRQRRAKTIVDATTGEKVRVRTDVESLTDAEGRTKEGIRAPERIEVEGIVRENKDTFLQEYTKITNIIPEFLTADEYTLLTTLNNVGTNAEAGKLLGISEATVSRRFNTIKQKFGSLIKDAGIDAEVLANPTLLKEQLDSWKKKQETVVKEVTKKAPSKKKITKATEEAKPAELPEEGGKRIAETAARIGKLQNPDPTPEPVPVNTTEAQLYRVSSEVTGNTTEQVLRPEKQADAIIDGSPASTKEAVVFTPKKPLLVSFNTFEDLEASGKLNALVSSGSRFGFDAIVLKDGSVLPMPKVEPTVVGRVENNKPVGLETVVSVTVKGNVPTKKVSPAPAKKRKAAEGHPVKVNKAGEVKGPEPTPAKSDVVKTSEPVRVERVINENKDTLRENGLDTNFLKRLLTAYWKMMKDVDIDNSAPYTPQFMRAWSKFIVINKEIMEANLKLFGKDKVDLFWKEVDKLRADEQVKKITLPAYKVRPDRVIFSEAAKKVDAKFIPFVTPDSVKMKVVNDEVVFSSKDPLVRSIISENKAESPVPTPPVPPAKEAAAEEVKLPIADDVELKEVADILENGIDKAESNASMPLRLSNLIGAIFGGSNRESANWWRELMNWMVNTSQTASATGRTIRSMQARIRFLSRMFDDTRAQTGHLAAAGKSAFRTALQAKADEKRLLLRIAKYQMRINSYLQDNVDQRKSLMLAIYRKQVEGSQLTDADIRAVGITDPTVVRTLVANSNELLKVVREANRTFLDLEAETGLVRTVDSYGNPVDADRWATVQLDHEMISRLSPTQREALVNALVTARTNRKLNEKTLDINTLIVLGWLDVKPNAQIRGTDLFAGDREIRSGLGINTFSKETLDKLRTGITYPIGTDPKNILTMLANKGLPNEYFVLKENGVLNVYRIPKLVDDLSDSDLIRYREAIQGNTGLYHPRWKEYLKNQNLIKAEMEEMLDFKTKSGKYSEFNSKTSTNIDRPIMRTGADEQTALAVPGLIPDEVLASPDITDVMRTNIAEAYHYFLTGRMFELLFQRELDRLLGSKGIKITQVFEWAHATTIQDLRDLAKQNGWSDAVVNARIQDVTLGINRLKEEYALNADTSPTIPNKELYSARAGLALMKMKVAPGYIMSTITEVAMELSKSNPIELPANLIDSIRFVLGDLRAKKSALLEEDIGDLPFVLDNFKSEMGDRFLGETAFGAFELDSKLRTKFIDSSKPLGTVDRGVRALETGARVAESLGSLQAVTNFVRNMASTRWQRRIWKHIKKQRIQKLLEVMERPDMKKLMDDLLKASETDPAAERLLSKRFVTEARKAGFGFEPLEAMIFFRYGLNTKEKIRHLEYLISKSGVDSSGRVNINKMVNTYWMHRKNPVAGIDNRVLEEVLSSYSFMLDDLVVKTSSPEPTGLGRITSIDSKTSFGRLWYALTSWIRGYQDSVILNYAGKSTLNYLAGSIVFFGVIDTLVGLFREWVGGREHEDIVDEFTNDPANFAIRVAKAAPIMGSANAALEAFLGGLSALSGGSWRYYGSPLSSIGVNAAGSATKDIITGTAEIAGQFTSGDMDGTKMVKALGNIVPYNSLFNRSPVAVPARMLEDLGALDQKGAVQKYLDMIQRDPYPYAKAQRQSAKAAPTGMTVTPQPRNLALERQRYEQARQQQIKTPPPMDSTSAKGVSGILGELLSDSQ